MKRISTMATAAIAGSLVLISTPASAQMEDLDAAEVAAATRYALPLAFDGYMARCSARLEPGGFAISNAENLRAKFNEGADAAWPGARAVIIDLATREAEDVTGLVSMLDDESLRPFVDGLIPNIAAQEIDLEDCETIERGLEILDPLPADNIAEMVGFLLEITANDVEEEAGTQ